MLEQGFKCGNTRAFEARRHPSPLTLTADVLRRDMPVGSSVGVDEYRIRTGELLVGARPDPISEVGATTA